MRPSRRACQSGYRIVRKLECQNGFGSAILVRTARADTIAAAPGGKIGQNDSTVIGPKEPAIGRGSVRDPAFAAGYTMRAGGGFDRRPGLDRLLIER